MILWRISEFPTLDGEGGRLFRGRWHSKGRPIVYAAESSALAMLEALVHLGVDDLPPDFLIMRIEAPGAIASAKWDGPIASENATRAWGDEWLDSAITSLARVPSAIAPEGWNWLINPQHSDAKATRIVEARRWPWDPQLVKL